MKTTLTLNYLSTFFSKTLILYNNKLCNKNIVYIKTTESKHFYKFYATLSFIFLYILKKLYIKVIKLDYVYYAYIYSNLTK